MRYDAIIIGAGLSGLAAALRLSLYEKRVLVLETHTRPGGLNSYYTRSNRQLDVGLHAFTNFVPPKTRNAALTRLCRQLRIRHEEWQLEPQWSSRIEFPSCTLRFTNEWEVFRASIADAFPAEIDAFDKLAAAIESYDEGREGLPALSARAQLGEYLCNPLLIDMLLTAPMFYGAACDNDMDWTVFIIMWKGIFTTGLSRPRCGMEALLRLLTGRLDKAGVEIRYRSPVREILTHHETAIGVRLEDGTKLEGKTVFSSAGWWETLALTDPAAMPPAGEIGTVSPVELLICTNALPSEWTDCRETSIFYSHSEPLRFGRSDETVNWENGLICISNHYGDGDALPEGRIRSSHIGSYPAWFALRGADSAHDATDDGNARYKAEKQRVTARMIEQTNAFIPGIAEAVSFTDLFTPLTLKRYTGHIEGQLYGCRTKHRDGVTPWRNLVVIGTDQGVHGIVGAMLSGVISANRFGLSP